MSVPRIWSPVVTVRLLYCPACKTETNHRYARLTNDWVCWCGCIVTDEDLAKFANYKEMEKDNG